MIVCMKNHIMIMILLLKYDINSDSSLDPVSSDYSLDNTSLKAASFHDHLQLMRLLLHYVLR